MSDSALIGNDPLLPVLHAASDGIALVAPHPWRLIFGNRTLASWLRRPIGGLCDIRLEEVFSAASWFDLMEVLDRVWKAGAPDAEVVIHLQGDDVDLRPMQARLCRVMVGEQPLVGVVLQAPTDVANPEACRAERRDPLTDLPDRAFLLSRLASLLQGERAEDRQFAVLFVDLDNFKQINDGYGHLIGDRVLREVAARLSMCVREGDRVTRFGGDEFVVLLERVAGRAEIDPVIGRIHGALAEPIVLSEGEFTLSLSIGVAEASPHHGSPEDVLREADREMYAAKRAGT